MRKQIIIFLTLSVFAFAYNEPFKYDPFARYLPVSKNGTIVSTKATMRVSAVMENKAFINGSWYKKGNKLGSYRIISISPNMVRLRSDEKTLILPVGKKVKKYLKIKDKN